jgi:hypothetical protein
MATGGAVPARLAAAAGEWAALAAGLVPAFPVRPVSAASHEPHVLSTICVELLQPLAAVAGRWTPGTKVTELGRVEVKIRHLEAIERKVGRDLGVRGPAFRTRALLEELAVRPTAPKREGGAPAAWFEVSVDEEEAATARRALETLAMALARGDGGSSRQVGPPDHRFRDAPAVLAFWSMKAEACSPGITQRLALRLARRSPGPAIAQAMEELLERLRAEPGDVAATERHRDLVALCERTLADLGRTPPA